MAKLIFTDSYEKKATKFLKKHPEIHSQYEKTLKILPPVKNSGTLEGVFAVKKYMC